VTCAVLGHGLDARALPVVRIAAPEGAYDYQNKYFTDDVKYQCPSGLPDAEEHEIQRITLAAYRTLGCRGWGRADVMIRASDRKPFLLEMNTSPGMTSHSLVPMSARAAGISYEDLCVRVLASATLDATGRLAIAMADSIPAPFDVKLMNIVGEPRLRDGDAHAAGGGRVVGAAPALLPAGRHQGATARSRTTTRSRCAPTWRRS
jgi:hypothetical protein